ncbi:MAG: glycosyltransferase family protein, partial [Thermomicrobiales bacterium]
AVDSRFDWAAVIAVAHAAPAERIDIFGPERIGRPMLPSNVTVHGPIPYVDLPVLLATYRVGLMPFNDHALNHGRSPMKYYEYLSAGLFVLGKSTPELERRRFSGSILYHQHDDIPDAAAAIKTLQSPNNDGRAVAQEMNWRSRAMTLLEFASHLKADKSW